VTLTLAYNDHTMQPGDRIQKSAAARAALSARGAELPASLRTLLLMIYGGKTAAEFAEIASRMPAGREGFKQLIDLGFVEVAAPPEVDQRAAAAPHLSAPLADVGAAVATHTVNEAELQRKLYPEFVRAVADLGLRGVILQMKVERAMSAQELLALRDQVETAVAKSKGEMACLEFAQRVNFLLSQ
jgi:hypothetical protein